MKTFRVKAVAEASGVTVRTLHHYDKIGLLVPSARTESGYRLYSEADLLRLQQILLHRELGLPLEQIRQLLDEPSHDARQVLVAQRAELQRRQRRNEAMLRAIDHALASLETNTRLNMKKLFDGFDPSQYEAEAQQRWGETDLYREAARRTKNYGPDEWTRMKQELDELMVALATEKADGKSPDHADVAALVERHRQHIDRWFYPCDARQHAALSTLYESDARFRANIDRHGEGLAAFLVAAIQAR